MYSSRRCRSDGRRNLDAFCPDAQERDESKSDDGDGHPGARPARRTALVGGARLRPAIPNSSIGQLISLTDGQTGRRSDVRRLSVLERRTFGQVIRDRFIPAAERVAADPGAASWPRSLRVKDVEGAPGVWEMTWSFSGLDGRATFEWREFDGEPGILWRRVGGHEIVADPIGD